MTYPLVLLTGMDYVSQNIDIIGGSTAGIAFTLFEVHKSKYTNAMYVECVMWDSILGKTEVGQDVLGVFPSL